MNFFFGFLCGLIVGGVVVHLIHEYLDAMLPREEIDKSEPPLWLGNKDEEKK